jgi:hypothetical protein
MLSPAVVAVVVLSTVVPSWVARTAAKARSSPDPVLLAQADPDAAPRQPHRSETVPSAPLDPNSLIIGLAGVLASLAIQVLRVWRDREKRDLKATIERLEKDAEDRDLVERIRFMFQRELDDLYFRFTGRPSPADCPGIPANPVGISPRSGELSPFNPRKGATRSDEVSPADPGDAPEGLAGSRG